MRYMEKHPMVMIVIGVPGVDRRIVGTGLPDSPPRKRTPREGCPYGPLEFVRGDVGIAPYAEN